MDWCIWRLKGMIYEEAEWTGICGDWVDWDMWRLVGVVYMEAQNTAVCGG